MSAQVDTHIPQVVEQEEFIPILDYQFTGDNYTVERKRAFIQAYHRKSTVTHAAYSTGVSRKTVYNWIDSDADFAEALEDAKVDTKEVLESSVYERAFKDSILAMFWLKAHDSKYRDRLTVDVEQVDAEIRSRLKTVTSSGDSNDKAAIPPPAPLEQKEE